MNVDQFDYELPEELIAQTPLPKRTASRLLHFVSHGTEFNDLEFTYLQQLLHAGDLLVLNNTEVIPARLYCKKASGGKVELLLERMLDARTALMQLKASKSPKLGSYLIFENGVEAQVKNRQDDFFIVDFKHAADLENLLNLFGQTPLPPYIRRTPNQEDIERYQTVYAQCKGAVAAPTAGLHFDKSMLEQLQRQGVECAYVTLHVGAGTFQPIRVAKIEEHAIHAEQVSVSQQVCDQVMDCKKRGGRVIAVGTTVVRALESAVGANHTQPYEGDSKESVVQANYIHPYEGETRLFIYPGFKFKVVDALITNFHLPKSTLLMLVCAFASYETTMSAYRHAIAKRYRFYSYGDAMFIEQQK